jgi:Fur family transcriptional regulator, iron response regulator
MARSGGNLQPTRRAYGRAAGHVSPKEMSLGERARGVSALESGESIMTRIRRAGLRPTRQRVALATLLLGNGERHFTAEMLFEEARRAKIWLSLATIYNTLHSFVNAGLLRQIPIDGAKGLFDTNVLDHHHFLVEGTNGLIDIRPSELTISRIPPAPDGFAIVKVDVIVRVRRKALCDVRPIPVPPAP